MIHYPKRHRIGRSEFVVDYLLGIEIIYPLILAGITAVGQSLSYLLEGLLDSASEASGKYRRLGRGIVGKLTRLRAYFHYLALIHDYHALTVGYRYSRAVRDDVVVTVLVGRATAYLLFPLYHEYIRRQSVAVKKFFPCVREHSTCRAHCCCYKSHYFLLSRLQGSLYRRQKLIIFLKRRILRVIRLYLIRGSEQKSRL